MDDSERRAPGVETIKDAYAGDVVVPDCGYAFTNIMLKQQFVEIWTRDVISMRDKRTYCRASSPKRVKLMCLKSRPKRREMKPDALRE